MTGGWASYSWPPAIVLTAVMVIFLMDLGAERYVEIKYGQEAGQSVEELITTGHPHSHAHAPASSGFPAALVQNGDVEAAGSNFRRQSHQDEMKDMSESIEDPVMAEKLRAAEHNAYRQQFAAFLILEFGVIVHSVRLPSFPPH